MVYNFCWFGLSVVSTYNMQKTAEISRHRYLWPLCYQFYNFEKFSNLSSKCLWENASYSRIHNRHFCSL